jgi:hypothetical protein
MVREGGGLLNPLPPVKGCALVFERLTVRIKADK